MKRIILAAMCALMLLLAPCALAQTITMEEAHLAFAYPEDTLVVSPQLALVYAPLLEDAGIDAQELSEALTAQGVLSRAYSPDFTQSLSVLVREDEEAFEELCDFLQEQKLLRAGVFPYSPEEGTPAAKMLNRVDTEEAVRA